LEALENAMSRYCHRLLCTLLLMLPSLGGATQESAPVRVGLLLDMEGPYAVISGEGSVVAAELAIRDYGGRVLGRPIELVHADHGNKVETAREIAARWLDEQGVNVIAEFVGSPIALAIQALNRDRAVLLFNAVVTTALTNQHCALTGIHWMYDSYVYTQVPGSLLTRQGYKRWYVIHLDNAYGQNGLANLRKAVEANGGTIIGTSAHSVNTPLMMRHLLKAEQAGAEVIVLLNAGQDMINGVKQAYDLRSVSRGKAAVAPIGAGSILAHDVGLGTTQGMFLTSTFYWNRDAETRAFSQRFYARTQRMPTESQAGVYTSLLHYFAAVDKAGTTDAPTVAAAMRSMPVRVPMIRNGRIRADGRMVHDVDLMQVKRPAESTGPWDNLKPVSQLAGDEAFAPLAQSTCRLVGRAGGDTAGAQQ
jgi:branched-chain amino acid transport system substrate-binding protein